MDILRLAVALVLPGLLGVVWLRWRWREESPGVWAMLIGYGYILGMLAATLMLRLVDAVGLPLDFTLIALILAVLMALGAWLSKGATWHCGALLSPMWRAQTPWKKWLFGLFLALITVRIAGLMLEIVWRPLFPWDAWTTWGIRPHVWFEYKRLIPFVDAPTWLAETAQTSYTIAAWNYPPAVSLIQLWTALGFGRWDESINNIPWLLCVLALGLGFYGQSRLWGFSPLRSILFTYLLLSIPIVDAHVALAGYADLWMVTAFGFAAIAFFQWLRTDDHRQGMTALVLALACPLIKLEGAVWILTFIPALMVARIAAKKLAWIVVLLSLLVLIGFVLGGFSAKLPWLGEVSLTPDLIQIPLLGRFELTFNANWNPLVQNLFVLDNWHLLWYLAVVAVLFSIPRIATNRLLRACSVLILAGVAMLFILFFMTGAYQWAEQYTSINRLFLHVTPALVFYVLILLSSANDRPLRIKMPSAPQSV